MTWPVHRKTAATAGVGQRLTGVVGGATSAAAAVDALTARVSRRAAASIQADRGARPRAGQGAGQVHHSGAVAIGLASHPHIEAVEGLDATDEGSEGLGMGAQLVGGPPQAIGFAFEVTKFGLGASGDDPREIDGRRHGQENT